jgi:(R)-2-hydroxyacyl-CoA dehydratese activating ATPase
MSRPEGILTLGVDLGSTAIKVALMSQGARIVSKRSSPTGHHAQQSAEKLVAEVLSDAGLAADDVTRTIATGYGRLYYEQAEREVSEITCHARGARFLVPAVRTIIDIGGQDSKAISLMDNGRVADFAMNDKCAAGTGRFLEVMARVLHTPIERFGELAKASGKVVPISTTCTVFAESEVVGLIARGEALPDIIAAIHRSVASRVASLARRVGVSDPIVATGGVARNVAALDALSAELDRPITAAPDPEFAGAIGAAIIAAGAAS